MQNSSMKKTEKKIKKNSQLNALEYGFDQIIPFLTDTIYIFKKSDVIAELVRTLFITQRVTPVDVAVKQKKIFHPNQCDFVFH